MGAFHLTIDYGDDTVVSFTQPNDACYEGIEQIYRRIFPTLQNEAYFIIGFFGGNVRNKEDRPNPLTGEGTPIDGTMTWEYAADIDSEGGCMSDEMRASFNYSRKHVTFVVDNKGIFTSTTVAYKNPHSWVPQDAEMWDDPTTENVIEQPPPKWVDKESWEKEVNYPYHRPRKMEVDVGLHPNVHHAYMWQWDNTGLHNFLADFRLIDAYPITGIFLADQNTAKLLAVASFRRPVLLRPDVTLYAYYKGRIF